MKASMDRRSFLLGTAAAGVLAAGGALAGCAPKASAVQEDSGSPATEVSLRPEAAPIEPVNAPASWDKEVDIVVVGSGGGGLNAASMARQLGLSIIVVEKSTIYGLFGSLCG